MNNEIIREKTLAQGSLTPAERGHVTDLLWLWTKRAARTDPIDLEKIIPAIEGMYAAAGLKKPCIAIAASPLALAFAYGAAAAACHALVLQLRISASFVVTDGGRGLMSSSP